MATVMDDNREALAMTETEADQVFQAIAEETILLTRQMAEYERRLAAVKAEAATSKAQSDAILKPLVKKLSDYIKVHPEQFEKVRAKKTPFGSYGMRNVSDLEITDEAALLHALMAHDVRDSYEVTTKIIKKVVERMVRSGDTRIAGVVIREGERAGYTVKKELLDNAKNTGGMTA